MKVTYLNNAIESPNLNISMSDMRARENSVKEYGDIHFSSSHFEKRNKLNASPERERLLDEKNNEKEKAKILELVKEKEIEREREWKLEKERRIQERENGYKIIESERTYRIRDNVEKELYNNRRQNYENNNFSINNNEKNQSNNRLIESYDIQKIYERYSKLERECERKKLLEKDNEIDKERERIAREKLIQREKENEKINEKKNKRDLEIKLSSNQKSSELGGKHIRNNVN